MFTERQNQHLPQSSSIYHYTSARRFLIDQVQKLRQENSWSVREVAKQMGTQSHSWLVMLLRGQRKLTLRQVPLLAKFLNLTTEEGLYLKVLIQMDGAQSEEEKQLCSTWLGDLRPVAYGRSEEWDHIHLLSDWIHGAILASTHLGAAPPTVNSLVAIFQGRQSSLEIQAAVERLLHLGLLEQNSAGHLRATSKSLTTRNDVSQAAVQVYHRNTSQLAHDAVGKQAVEEREFQSFSTAISRRKIPLVKEAIRRFKTQLIDLIRDDQYDEIYQVNLQFFRLTELPLCLGQTVDQGAGTFLPAESGEKLKQTKEERNENEPNSQL